MFRGRETQHPELGRRILDNVADRVTHLARVEVMPKLDGRNMTMVLAPDKKAKAAWDAQRKAESEAEPSGNGASAPAPAATSQDEAAPERTT
jgi:translation initiation factor IF-3